MAVAFPCHLYLHMVRNPSCPRIVVSRQLVRPSARHKARRSAFEGVRFMKFRALIAAALALAVVASIAVAPASPAFALPGDARVAGTVTDSVSGAPLPNVCVVNGPVAIRCWTITNSE